MGFVSCSKAVDVPEKYRHAAILYELGNVAKLSMPFSCPPPALQPFPATGTRAIRERVFRFLPERWANLSFLFVRQPECALPTPGEDVSVPPRDQTVLPEVLVVRSVIQSKTPPRRIHRQTPTGSLGFISNERWAYTRW